MTVAAENVIDSPTRVTDSTSAVRAAGRGPARSESRDRNRPCWGAPGHAGHVVAGRAQFLPDPEDQEQPVVGAGAEDQDDQQELGERRHLEAVLGRLGHQRTGDEHGQQGGQDRGDGERQRPEDEHEQQDDEDQRQVLHLVAGVAGRLLLVNLNGDAARQVDPQPGGQPGAGDLRAHAVDEVLLVVLVAAVVGGQGEQLHSLAVGGTADVEHLLDPGHGVELGLQGRHGADVRRGERPAGGRRDDGDREQVRAAERRGQVDRVLARRAGRQELGVVALGHARQRRQLGHGRDRAPDPDEQNQPAKTDRPAADSPENRIDAHGQEAYWPAQVSCCGRPGSPHQVWAVA